MNCWTPRFGGASATGSRWIFPLADLRQKMWAEFVYLEFTPREIELLVDLSEGFSGSDIHEVCVRLQRRRITTHKNPPN